MSAAPDSIPPDCRGDHRLPARLGCHLHMPRPKKRAANGRPYYPSFLYHPTQKCHCLPSRRFATTGLSFTPPATASLFTTANAFPRETLPRTNGIPEQSAKFAALQIPELLMGFGSRLRARSSAALTVPWTVIHYRSPPNPISKKLSHPQGMREFFGAANGIRTHDLVITNDVLYRLSYSSVSNA